MISLVGISHDASHAGATHIEPSWMRVVEGYHRGRIMTRLVVSDI
jgi:hypothetical protein